MISGKDLLNQWFTRWNPNFAITQDDTFFVLTLILFLLLRGSGGVSLTVLNRLLHGFNEIEQQGRSIRKRRFVFSRCSHQETWHQVLYRDTCASGIELHNPLTIDPRQCSDLGHNRQIGELIRF